MRFRRQQNNSKTESEMALQEAQARLAEIKERGTEVTDEARRSRETRTRNHFMEQFEELIIFKKVQSDE